MFAWRDLGRALSAMPWLVLAAAGYALIVIIPDYLWWPERTPFWLDVAILAVATVYFVPLGLAIHRFIVLGEVSGVRVDIDSSRFRRFSVWSLLLMMVGMLIWVPYWIVTDTEVAAMLTGLLMAPLLYLLARLIILFPAIAVDAPHASLKNALDETRGQTWRIAAIAVVTWLPVVVPVFGRIAVTGEDLAASIWTMMSLVCELTAVAFASRLYEERHMRVGPPAEQPPRLDDPPTGPVTLPQP
jgi:hypothetical protein